MGLCVTEGPCQLRVRAQWSMVLGIDHIALRATPGEQANARWFYGSLLGMSEVAVPRTIMSDVQPLCFRTAAGQDIFIPFDRVSHSSDMAVQVGLRVRCLKTVRESLEANGFEVFDGGDLKDEWTRCFCRDPFGNRIEFLERVPAESRGAA